MIAKRQIEKRQYTKNLNTMYFLIVFQNQIVNEMMQSEIWDRNKFNKSECETNRMI